MKLALAAVLMVGILLIGLTGCGTQEVPDELVQLQKDVAQLQKQHLGEKQDQELKLQKEAEEKRIAQLVASAAEEKLADFEAKLAEKEKEARLAQLEKSMAELKAQIAAQTSQSARKNCPSSVRPYPGSTTTYPNSIASFIAEVYGGENFNEYVGPLPSSYPISFDWGYGGPLGLTNYFSIRWEGNTLFESGTYRFRARADDGFRLYVDGNLLLDKWSPHTTRTYEVTRSLSGYHNIKLEYREITGISQVSLSWEKIQ